MAAHKLVSASKNPITLPCSMLLAKLKPINAMNTKIIMPFKSFRNIISGGFKIGVSGSQSKDACVDYFHIKSKNNSRLISEIKYV